MNIAVHVPSDFRDLMGANPAPNSALELALLERLNVGRAALPMLPAVAQSALQLVNNPDTNIAEFARLVEKDPPIAARFLSVANSALYSRGRKVTSLEEAVMRLGLYACRDLLMQVVYASTLSGLKRYQREVQASFQRSVHSGLTCRAVCATLDIRFREAYLCGLLHDIGESRVYRILSELGEPASEAEAALLVHRYHERAGVELADLWKLPPEIQEVCQAHHTRGQPTSDAIRIVRIADLLIDKVQQCAAANEPEFGSDAFTGEQYDELRLSVNDARQVVASAAALVAKAA